jgi:hypothetical protein
MEEHIPMMLKNIIKMLTGTYEPVVWRRCPVRVSVVDMIHASNILKMLITFGMWLSLRICILTIDSYRVENIE